MVWTQNSSPFSAVICFKCTHTNRTTFKDMYLLNLQITCASDFLLDVAMRNGDQHKLNTSLVFKGKSTIILATVSTILGQKR